MRRVNEGHIFQGMQRDLSVSKHPIQFLYDGRNIRLTARDGESTLLSVVNEKGTLDADTTVDGEYLGHCLLNEYLVLFTTEGSSDTSTDHIYRINLKTLEVKPLFTGEGEESLGFSTDYPIEAIASYESDMIQKVYWTDGNNQPRVINIIGDKESGVETFHYTNKSFDFIPELLCREEVTVKKLVGANGMFAPGVIQYAFTYYYQYGQETNIFYTTPLYYISPNDRGASPEEKVDNAFKITIKIDTSETGYKIPFDFLRIYSIQRTSINATPFVKRIQDINLQGLSPLSPDEQFITVSYTDTGVNGDAVDPTELLYKGGESIKALTMEQKDSTLFLGNITLESPGLDINLRNSIASNTTVSCGYRYFKPHKVSDAPYAYYNQLNASKVEKKTEGNVSIYITYPDVTVPCGGFKKGDYYRLGVQFQHKTGKWSEPVLLQTEGHDYEQTNHPEWNFDNEICEVPIFEGVISTSDVDSLIDNDYIKARAIAVFPNIQDRVVVCQGVVCPTMYTTGQRADGSLHAQSSWLFRVKTESYTDSDWLDEVGHGTYLPYLESNGSNKENALDIFRKVEIQGEFDVSNKFQLDTTTLTLHSPDVEFDTQLQVTDYNAFTGWQVGNANITNTLSDIDIQTETPAISDKGSGFVHKSASSDNYKGIITGLYYDDFVIDDDPSYGFIPYKGEGSSVKWPVYMWHQNGSLNNDINRPVDKGVQSALLKKKAISNLRVSRTDWMTNGKELHSNSPQLFASNEVTILKIQINNQNKYIYKGNIDTALNPDKECHLYFAYNAENLDAPGIVTSFDEDIKWRLNHKEVVHGEGVVPYTTTGDIQKLEDGEWNSETKGHIGDDYNDLAKKKNPVRMKYKSTPHLVFYSAIMSSMNKYISDLDWQDNALPIVELRRAVTSDFLANIYGGNSEDSLRANVWIPVGEPIVLTVGKAAEVRWEYGDTYYQRWDCLKTYPFTKEDINQVVEIGSFMLETRVNIDGRYDRNRGQQNNLNMSPQNFNLMNPVYSQLNNFFTYRKLDDDFYKNNKFPNQITWTKQKQSGADVDLWTNITLAAVYDMDGSKGEVRSLNAWKDQIYCFQDKGVSNILFNSRVQMPTSDGVPIEISNNYKVDGYRYLSDGIGCNNKLLVKETPVGIYFIDSVGNHLFHISDSLKDVSQTCNLTTLFDNYKNKWKRLLYDDINHDLYIVNEEESLGYSETLGQFTGFYDYDDISLIETCNHHVFTLKDNRLHKMFEGDYGKIFGKNYPWSFTFISNGLSDNMTVVDKTFTNLEFRATVEEDGKVVGGGGSGSGSGSSTWESTFDFTFDYTFTGYDGEGGSEGEGDGPKRFVPYLPVDSLETWNEYQHGMASLQHKNGHGAMIHHLRDDDKTAALKRKFRIWRCDIPRDNAAINRVEELKIGVFRKGDKPHYVDRMRNPWLYLKLSKKAASAGESLHKTEIHDIIVSYFS